MYLCFLWQALLKALAETELDDAKDLLEADVPQLNAIIRERGSVQLSFIQKPVSVRGWPLGLALASAPSITMSLTATGFQKMVSVMASLNLPSRRGEYKLEPNQYSQELASIRAQPKVRAHPRQFFQISSSFYILVDSYDLSLLSYLGICKAALPAVSTPLR